MLSKNTLNLNIFCFLLLLSQGVKTITYSLESFPKHRLTLGLLFPHFLKAKVITNRGFKKSCVCWELSLSFHYQLIQRPFPLRKAIGSLDNEQFQISSFIWTMTLSLNTVWDHHVSKSF